MMLTTMTTTSTALSPLRRSRSLSPPSPPLRSHGIFLYPYPPPPFPPPPFRPHRQRGDFRLQWVRARVWQILLRQAWGLAFKAHHHLHHPHCRLGWRLPPPRLPLIPRLSCRQQPLRARQGLRIGGIYTPTNKITSKETCSIPHHLLGGVPPDADFTASDFCHMASRVVDSIAQRRQLSVVAGGLNLYIKELIEGAGREFGSRYECHFLWVDVELKELCQYIVEWVDLMVERGLVEEVRGVFNFNPEAAGYDRGIRRAIGVPEMDRFLRAEAEGADEVTRARLLEAAIDEIKANTCKLACCQLRKINRLRAMPGWDVRRVDATVVFRKRGEEADRSWDELVAGPSIEIVREFLNQERDEGLEEGYFVANGCGKLGEGVRANETVVGPAAAGAATKMAAAVVVGAMVRGMESWGPRHVRESRVRRGFSA